MILRNKSKGLHKSRFKVREMGEVQITQRIKKKPQKTNTKEKKPIQNVSIKIWRKKYSSISE